MTYRRTAPAIEATTQPDCVAVIDIGSNSLRLVLDAETAVEWSSRGEDVILVREETNPDDLHGMVAARGTLTSRGGKTSHAAVVARGMGRPCVCGAEALLVDPAHRRVQVRGGPVLDEGDVISLDGTIYDLVEAGK